MKSGFIDKIKANKQVLIQELVDEFGNEWEELLNSRFDKIKFIVFVNLPDLKKELKKKYSKNKATKVKEFIIKNHLLNDVVIDDESKDYVGYQILPCDKEKRKFEYVFDANYLDFNFEYEEEFKPVFGIFSFDNTQDYDRLAKWVQHRGMSVEDFVINNRCTFLRNIGAYPSDFTNIMIINDSRYEQICSYYSNLMDEYNRITVEVKNELNKEFEYYNKLVQFRKKVYINCYKKLLETDLFSFLSEKDKNKIMTGHFELDDIDFLNFFFNIGQELSKPSKIENDSDNEMVELSLSYYQGNIPDNLKEKVQEAREKACKKFYNEIKKAFLIECNCDINELELDHDISIESGTMHATFFQEDGKEKARYIFFSPYSSDEKNYDVLLRHELRHSLTSSIREEGEYIVVKVGNQEFYYCDDELVRNDNELYNELLTQQKALENTKKSFDKGIYILSPSGCVIESEYTSDYDVYLKKSDVFFRMLPDCILMSQIECTNDNLYAFMTREDIKNIEEKLEECYWGNDSMKEIINALDEKLQSLLLPKERSK